MDKVELQIEIIIATNIMMEFVVKHLQISAKEMETALKSYQHYQETKELPAMASETSTSTTSLTDDEKVSIGKIFLTIVHMYRYGDNEILPMAKSLMDSLWQLIRMCEPLQKTKCPATIDAEYMKLPMALKERYAQEMLSLESLKNTLYY